MNVSSYLCYFRSLFDVLYNSYAYNVPDIQRDFVMLLVTHWAHMAYLRT